MQHRIPLSTQVLIAAKAAQRKKVVSKPAVIGIRVKPQFIAMPEKSSHSVDLNGNIIQTAVWEEFAA